jgi:hypothetical protein
MVSPYRCHERLYADKDENCPRNLAAVGQIVNRRASCPDGWRFAFDLFADARNVAFASS